MECLKTWMFDMKTDDFHFSRHTTDRPASQPIVLCISSIQVIREGGEVDIVRPGL